jgi:hypothetical protein
MRIILLFLVLIIQYPVYTLAQNVNNLPITVLELDGTDLEFGQIVSGSGVDIIPIEFSKVLSVSGARFLDVFVEISAGDALLRNSDPSCQGDPACSIPFTLEAAYANNGVNETGQSTPFTVNSNFAAASFKILENGGNASPFLIFLAQIFPNAFQSTAYIYIFGSINTGPVLGGNYSNSITVTVVHD